MNTTKEQELLRTYQLFVASFMENSSVDELNDILSPDIMGFGTTSDEKVFGIEAVRNLNDIGKQQKQSLEDYHYTSKIIKKQISKKGDAAIIITEINLGYSIHEIKTVMPLRITTVLFFDETWKVIHWHGSLGVESEGDTWHQNEWQRDNDRLQKKVDEQTAELKKSLVDLKATQSQLIQSEKMASLGELTAGIAHEIQNPLNFVNNFSEVSNELVDEMNEELDKGDLEEAKAISLDIKQNLEKINHHGKRADAIVKGMLQHSRSNTGKKEPTDINALADEYLRLAYHGLRAKDKSFNAQLVTDFDDTIGNINIISQDMGRVILNLITNAFYAVNEKKKEQVAGYEPTVSISTKKNTDTIELKVTDNGKGIPESVKEKVFQPFFTTKPTGEGTGLGLSLSYDIITKGHGGELKVNTKQNIGTEFSINLPL
ncbi:sensor histidine kinase [Maribacter sp. ACAM166]|uniref:sensor histidine kinase n=1 Tax=Maribacter sp. ACAM166 TaxID=2508996 RepID=UPI002017ABA4|nr:ATP-binding protein [Maribacter sp. ACAM166]